MPKLLTICGMDEKLGLDKVKLLDQRMCPVYNERLVTPDSPTVEFEGKTVYLYNKSALRRFNKSPENTSSVLEDFPQLPGNKAKRVSLSISRFLLKPATHMFTTAVVIG